MLFLEMIAVTLTANFATGNIMALLFGEDLGGKQFCIEIRVLNNVEGYLNVDGTRFSFCKRMRKSERYIKKPSVRNGTKFCTSDGKVCWTFCGDVGRRVVRRYSTGERTAILFAAGRLLMVCDV